MWKLFLVWQFIHRPLPSTNPFANLPFLSSNSKIVSNKPYKRFIWRFISLISLMIIIYLFTVIGLLVIIDFGGLLFLMTVSLPVLVGTMWVGGYFCSKITHTLNKLRYTGTYDLISISPYGEQYATWAIGNTIYKKIGWLKKVHFVIRTSIYAIVGILLFIVISGALKTGTDSELPAYQVQNDGSLINIVDFCFLIGGIYFYLVQAIVMGHLMALWSNTIDTNSENRMAISISGFIANQLIIYTLCFIVLFTRLPNLYSTNWVMIALFNGFRFIIFIILLELHIRLIMNQLIHRTELPYSVWRSEVGI